MRFAVRRWPGGPWRSPPLVATTSSSSVRRAVARRCWRSASPACSRRSTGSRRWRRRWCTRRPGCGCHPAGSFANHRFGRRTTPRRSLDSWAAARINCGRARSRSPRTGCCSWTSWASSAGQRSRDCASHSRRASSASLGRRSARSCRPGSCSSPPPTRARAAVALPARASATTAHVRGTCVDCQGPSPIASTCVWSSSDLPSTSFSASNRASRRRSCASG